VNRVLLEPESGCRRCRRAQQWQMCTLQTLRQKYGAHRLYLVRDFPEEIAGAQKLKRFTGELWQIQAKD
jgi:hypothetical protein